MSLFNKKGKKVEPAEEEIFEHGDEDSQAFGGEDFLSAPQEETLASFSTESTGILRVGNIDYAVGLFWQPVEDASKAVQEARRIAQGQGIGADFFCHPYKGALQIGLGAKESSHRSGMASLAAHLVSTVGHDDNWIGIFKSDGSWYVIAFHSGAILAKTDQVFLKEADAIEAFNRYYQASDDWVRVYALPSMGLAEADETELDEILTGKPTSRLRPINTKPLLIRAGMALVAAGVLAAVITQGPALFFGPSEPDLSLFDSSRSPRPGRDRQAQPETALSPAPVAPWAKSPSASSFIVACDDAFQDLVLDYPGWRLDSAACGPHSFDRNLERSGGTINWLEPYIVETLGTKDAVISLASTKQAVVSTPIRNANRIPRAIKTEPLGRSSFYLISHLDEIGHEIEFSSAELTPEENLFYDAVKFGLQTQERPTEFLPLFSLVPALVIDRIVYRADDHLWEIEGKLYEKRDEPLPPT